MTHLHDLALALIDRYGYAGLFLGMAAGNIGAPIGSELVLPLAGALVATGHLGNLWLTIAVAVAGELTGGFVGYAAGRWGGRPFVERYGRYVRLHHRLLDRVDAFFARFGVLAIFICRFVPVIRGIAAIPAGIGRMPPATFAAGTVAGSTLFCGGLILAGNALGRHLNGLITALHRGTFVTLVAVAAAVAAIAAVSVVRTRRARA